MESGETDSIQNSSLCTDQEVHNRRPGNIDNMDSCETESTLNSSPNTDQEVHNRRLVNIENMEICKTESLQNSSLSTDQEVHNWSPGNIKNMESCKTESIQNSFLSTGQEVHNRRPGDVENMESCTTESIQNSSPSTHQEVHNRRPDNTENMESCNTESIQNSFPNTDQEIYNIRSGNVENMPSCEAESLQNSSLNQEVHNRMQGNMENRETCETESIQNSSLNTDREVHNRMEGNMENRETCETESIQNSSLNTDQEVHNGMQGNMENMETCETESTQNSSLNTDQEVHNKRQENMEGCETTYTQNSSLNTGQEVLPVCKRKLANAISSICSICESSFINQEDFKQHIAIVGCGGDERFPCDNCNKSFSTSGDLKKHQGIKDGRRKKFICDVCYAEFTCKRYLNHHHIRITSCKLNLSNVICSVCNFLFKRMADFKQHTQTVRCGGKERFLCNICNKIFCNFRSLQNHKETLHGTNKGYSSDTSNAGFIQKSSLILNKATACGNNDLNTVEEYTCHFCNSSFPKRKKLKNHMKTAGCGTERVEVQAQSVVLLGDNSSITPAKGCVSPSSSLLPPSNQSEVEVSSSMPLLEHAFKVYMFKNTNAVDFSTFISLKMDEIKNTIRAQLESHSNSGMKPPPVTGEVECIEIEGKSQEEVLRRFGPYRSQFIPIVDTQEIDKSVTLMLDEAMSHCPREGS